MKGTNLKKIPIKVKCPKCEYLFSTRTRLRRACCSNCNHRFVIKENEVKDGKK